MNRTLLFCTAASILLLSASGTVQAEAPAHCLQQARELALRAGEDIFPDMTAIQRSRLQQLAADTCAGHAAATAADKTGSAGDSFTDYVLKGEPADKPGNRRLERRTRQ